MSDLTSEKTYLSDLIGTVQTLKVSRLTEHGAYLVAGDSASVKSPSRPVKAADTSSSRPAGASSRPTGATFGPDEVLLPTNQLTPGLKAGATVDVFLYKDSEDRLIATREQPLLTLGGTAVLTVIEVTRIGAFLNWGLKKDLFLPFKEQTARVRPGDKALVTLYVDKSERLCATMHVYDYLSTNSPYMKNDRVRGRVYEITESFGVFVAVEGPADADASRSEASSDDTGASVNATFFSALIPKNEFTGDIQVGDIIEARVREVREDGKLTLTLQEKTKVQMRSDADRIFARLTEAGGFLPFHDKTAPAIINREFGISKAAFKRALGRLKKEGRITIGDDGIRSAE